METNPSDFNQNIRRGVEDFLHANPEILQPIVEDIIEDYMLGKAMEKCEGEGAADFDETMAFLNAHRTKE